MGIEGSALFALERYREKGVNTMKIAMLSDIFRDDLELSDLYKLYKEDEDMPLDKRAANLLYDLTLPPNYKGYKYLKEAITMLCEDNTDYNSFTKQLYPALAEKFDTTPQNIEKNIRFAIRKIYEFNSPEDLERHLGRSPIVYSKPSNVKFITYCAEKLRLER